jgi:hypothetical protein
MKCCAHPVCNRNPRFSDGPPVSPGVPGHACPPPRVPLAKSGERRPCTACPCHESPLKTQETDRRTATPAATKSATRGLHALGVLVGPRVNPVELLVKARPVLHPTIGEALADELQELMDALQRTPPPVRSLTEHLLGDHLVRLAYLLGHHPLAHGHDPASARHYLASRPVERLPPAPAAFLFAWPASAATIRASLAS